MSRELRGDTDAARREKPLAYEHVPYDIDIEQALLGTLLRNNDKIDLVSAELDGEHFYDPLHGRVYEMITALRLEGVVNPTVLHSIMKGDPGVIETGGLAYFEALVAAAPLSPAIAQYSAILKDLAGRRAIIRACEETIARAYEAPSSANRLNDIADIASETFFQVGHMGGGTGQTMRPLRDFAQEAVQQTEQAILAPAQAYLTSGLRSVDDECGPLFRGDVTVLGGATSMAKTALAQKSAKANALLGHCVVFFSLEMGGAQLATRYISQEIRISSDRLRRGKLSTAEFEAMALSPGQHFHDLPLWIDDTPNQSVAQMRAKVQWLNRERARQGLPPVALVVVDHLQFVQAADQRAEERDQLRQITKDLKSLAKEFGLAVLLLSHITKENERRVTKRPVLADLYGSSGIQQNADAVMFVYREHYYLSREKPDPNKGDDSYSKWIAATERTEGWAEIFTDKNRMGKIGSARVRFIDYLTEFSDPEPANPADPELALEERPFG